MASRSFSSSQTNNGSRSSTRRTGSSFYQTSASSSSSSVKASSEGSSRTARSLSSGDQRRRSNHQTDHSSRPLSNAPQTIRRSDSLMIRRYMELHSSYSAFIALGILFVVLLGLANMPVFHPILTDLLAPISYTVFQITANSIAAIVGLLILRGAYCYLRPPPSLRHLSQSERILLGLPLSSFEPEATEGGDDGSSNNEDHWPRTSSSIASSSSSSSIRSYGSQSALTRRLTSTRPAFSSHSQTSISRFRTSPYETISPSGRQEIRNKDDLDRFLNESFASKPHSQVAQGPLRRGAASDFNVRAASFDIEQPAMKWQPYRTSIVPTTPILHQTDKFGPANEDAATLVLDRLGISRERLDDQMDRMKIWLSKTIVQPLLVAIDTCDKDGVLHSRPPCAYPAYLKTRQSHHPNLDPNQATLKKHLLYVPLVERSSCSSLNLTRFLLVRSFSLFSLVLVAGFTWNS